MSHPRPGRRGINRRDDRTHPLGRNVGQRRNQHGPALRRPYRSRQPGASATVSTTTTRDNTHVVAEPSEIVGEGE